MKSLKKTWSCVSPIFTLTDKTTTRSKHQKQTNKRRKDQNFQRFRTYELFSHFHVSKQNKPQSSAKTETKVKLHRTRQTPNHQKLQIRDLFRKLEVMHVCRVVNFRSTWPTNIAKRRRNSKKLERERESKKQKNGTHGYRSQAFVALCLGLAKR